MSEEQPAGEAKGREHRNVRSFVRREGRMTRAQTRAWAELWPRWGLALPARPTTLDLDALFGRTGAPRVLEIGFGDGEALASLAGHHPEWDLLGVEVHRPGVGHLLLTLETAGLENVRVLAEDAVPLLRDHLPVASLDRIHVWFPDPWPKKRHHKRRLLQPAVTGLMASRLRPGGVLHFATDWEPYAEQVLAVLEATPGLVNERLPGAWAEGPGERPQTRFERRGRRLGHRVRDLRYRRVDVAAGPMDGAD